MIILACEGSSEVYLMESLINFECLHFDELFLFKPIRMRQLTEQKHLINAMKVDTPLTVFRIGDTLKDEISLDGFEIREKYIRCFKFCTKTEVEVLILINENLYDEYRKQYRKLSPKEFLKQKLPNISVKEYFETHNMSNAIYHYRKLKKHQPDELFLADLLDAYKASGRDIEDYFRNKKLK